jgi:hypothetical protein
MAQTPQIEFDDWIQITTDDVEEDTFFIRRSDLPFELEDDCSMHNLGIFEPFVPVPGESIIGAGYMSGWGARMSSGNGLGWEVFESQDEARVYIIETYGLCPDCGTDLDEESCNCE